MSGPDYARTAAAARNRRRKAQQLARWCYYRGIGPGVLAQPPQVLRAAARRAAVNPPRHDSSGGGSATWELVAELLQARARWDRAHDRRPPEHVPCIPCAVLDRPCPRCAASRVPAPPPAAPLPPEGYQPPAVCPSCRHPLDAALPAAGIALHPACEPRAAESPEPARHAALF